MGTVFARIRVRAREIADRFPLPEFYRKFEAAHSQSLRFFESDKVVGDVADHVNATIENDYGHGRAHVLKVSLDAGALIIIEGTRAGVDVPVLQHQLRQVQCAGLLHDIRRKEPDHASAGAVYAARVLAAYPFSAGEVADICHAIRNHEAFKPHEAAESFQAELVCACLYDADKFRWGPDNFKHTLWDMVDYSGITLTDFMAHYPKGMESLTKIRSTFRTETGKTYGPEIIDTGIAIGHRLHGVIRTEFSEYL